MFSITLVVKLIQWLDVRFPCASIASLIPTSAAEFLVSIFIYFK